MSKRFMEICATERSRLNSRISRVEATLNAYRQLYKLYGELAELDTESGKTWNFAREFVHETVAPALKQELAAHRETLELVTKAQERGCMEIGQNE